jgi:hypothetical protein
MALVPCPDCGRMVSNSASRCPDCGRPFAWEAAGASVKVKAGKGRRILGGTLMVLSGVPMCAGAPLVALAPVFLVGLMVYLWGRGAGGG